MNSIKDAFWNIFRSDRATPPPCNDVIYPVHYLDHARIISGSVMSYTLQYDDVLDAEKLRRSFIELLTVGDWRKLGGRLRRNNAGRFEIRVPEEFTDARLPVRFSHVKWNVAPHEHPIGRFIPQRTGDLPSSHESVRGKLRSLCIPDALTTEVNHWLKSDEPLVYIHVVSFTDTTLISLTFPHLVADIIGTGDILRAWSLVLAGRTDEVPPLQSAWEDPMSSVGTSTDQVASQNPYILRDMQLKGFSMALFVLRFIWDRMTRTRPSTKTIILPAWYMSHLREQALGPQGRHGPFLSDADIITAWAARLCLNDRPGRPAIVCSIFELRSRLTDVFVKDGVYLQNLTLPATVIVEAAPFPPSLTSLAIKVRQSIQEQATGPQARGFFQLARPVLDSALATVALFGTADSMTIGTSNWSKAKLIDIDFAPAIIAMKSSEKRDPLTPAGLPVTYWGSSMSKNDEHDNAFFVYGKDRKGDYWLTGCLRPETERLMEQEFKDAWTLRVRM